MPVARVVALIVIAGTTLACKQIVRTKHSGFILGASNDMEELKVEEESKDMQRFSASTVLIATELIGEGTRKFCSGSVIAPEKGDDEGQVRILTNFHCFAKTTEDGVVDKEFLPEACDETNVYFGFTKDDPDSTVDIACESGTLIGDFIGDLAVFKLSGPAPKAAKPLELWQDPEIPADRKAVIIHHPDISERFTKITKTSEILPAATITKEDCQTNGDFAPDEWRLDHTLPYSVRHTCDLIHGSSGSSLIDVESGQILGVNWGGIEIKYKSGKEKFNAATKGFYVNAFLNGELAPLKERSADLAERAALKREQKQKERASGGKVGSKVNDLFCGSVGLPASALPHLTMFLFLMPLALVFRSIRTK